MQPHQQSPDSGSPFNFGAFMSWLVFASRALATTVEVYLHSGRSFGDRYLGLPAFAGAVFLFFYPILWEHHDVEPLMWFFGGFLLLCFAARGAAAARWRRGAIEEHSYYSGRPRLMCVLPRLSEERIKATAEPVLVIGAGFFVYGASAPLGSYLMLAGVGLAVAVDLAMRQERRRALDLNDAQIDQGRIAELWRQARRQDRY